MKNDNHSPICRLQIFIENVPDLMVLMFTRYIAQQMKNPSGFVGRHVLGRLWNSRNAALNDQALANLELQRDDCVLDVGCGGGYLLGRMLQIVTSGQVAGIDAAEVMIDHCRGRFKSQLASGQLELHCSQVESIPYPASHFTMISSVNSLFYWSNVASGFREIHRVLTESGRFVLTYTCKGDLDRKGFSPHGIRSYDDEEIMKALVAAGFHDLSVHCSADRYRAFKTIVAQNGNPLRGFIVHSASCVKGDAGFEEPA